MTRRPIDPPALSPEIFDVVMKPRPRERREKPVWTLEAIGALINVGPDFVRTLAQIDGSPIHEIGGRYFAYESELIAFIKGGRRKAESPATR